jgi:peptidoglycan hydrolase CwlO-like protein
VILNGTIYWKATEVTNDYRGLVSVVLIDAKTGQARTISLADRKSLSYVDAMNTLIQGGVGGIEKEGRQDIVKRIENLEKLIQSLRSYLDELEKELEELKRQIGGG